MADEEEDPASTSHSTSARGLHTCDCETPSDVPIPSNVSQSAGRPNPTAGSSMDHECPKVPRMAPKRKPEDAAPQPQSSRKRGRISGKKASTPSTTGSKATSAPRATASQASNTQATTGPASAAIGSPLNGDHEPEEVSHPAADDGIDHIFTSCHAEGDQGDKMADEEEDPASTSHNTSDRGFPTSGPETPLDAPATSNVLKSTGCPNATAGSSMDSSHVITKKCPTDCEHAKRASFITSRIAGHPSYMYNCHNANNIKQKHEWVKLSRLIG